MPLDYRGGAVGEVPGLPEAAFDEVQEGLEGKPLDPSLLRHPFLQGPLHHPGGHVGGDLPQPPHRGVDPLGEVLPGVVVKGVGGLEDHPVRHLPGPGEHRPEAEPGEDEGVVPLADGDGAPLEAHRGEGASRGHQCPPLRPVDEVVRKGLRGRGGVGEGEDHGAGRVPRRVLRRNRC